MDPDVIIIVAIFIVAPGVLFPLAIWYLKSDGFNRRFPNALYQFSIFGKTVVLSKHLIIQLFVILLLYSWVDTFFPLPFALIAIAGALVGLRIAKAKRVVASDLSRKSEALINRIEAMQKEIGGIRQHMESLGLHIITRQIELDEKEEIKRRLDSEIEEKSNEAEFWTSLTDEQRNLVLDAAVQTVQVGTRGQFILGIILGFFINLLAALTWALLGSPGKEQIMENFTRLLKISQ